MNGCVFKRNLKSGTTWGYSFLAGRDQNGKRINPFKSGYETKGAASAALRTAILDYEKTHGKITKHRGILGTVTWGYILEDETKKGFPDQNVATAALAAAVERRAAAEQAPPEVDPTFAAYVCNWFNEHAGRRLAPKTLERYKDFAEYLIRHLGETRMNSLTTALIQRVIHRLSDSGGLVTKDHPNGRPLAPKTVRNIGAMLYTCLAEADRLGDLKIPHPMRDKRVKLPKLQKRDPAVVDKEKLRLLFDRARTTRLYPFVVLASAAGCRRGELLALQWPDLNMSTGELSVSKSLEQTKAGLRVKSTKSEKPRHFAVPESVLPVLADHRAEQDNDKRLYGPDYQDHDLIFCQPNGAYYSPDRVGRPRGGAHGEGRAGGRQPPLPAALARHPVLSNGVPHRRGLRRLGHADQNITLSIYSHALPADTGGGEGLERRHGGRDSTSKKPAPAQVCKVLHGSPRNCEFLLETKEKMAGTTGLEPATSDVTGRRPLRAGIEATSLHFQFVARITKSHSSELLQYVLQFSTSFMPVLAYNRS